METTNIFRWIHILTAAIWFGEVVVINIVLVPVLMRLENGQRIWFLASIFPRIFRLASIAIITVLLSGAALNLSLSNWQIDIALTRLTSGRWGASLLIAGGLGLALGLFHFFAEHRLEKRISNVKSDSGQENLDFILRNLRIIPRVGLVILLTIFAGMMFAARGF